MSIEEESKRLRKKIEEEEKNPLRIALFGQPGAGKSSIINSLVGKKVAETDVKTDTTTEAEIFPYTKDLVLVDLPGYGTSKFPPDSFTDRFNPEDYHLFLCVFSGKFHQADTRFFQELKQKGRICLFVRSKSDEIWEENKNLDELKVEIIKDVEKQIQERTKVYFVSNRKKEGFGILYEAIQDNLDDAYQERWHRSAKAYTTEALESKKKACEKQISIYAGLAAANGLNPIPGVNIAVDAGIIVKLFDKIRENYGLTKEKIDSLAPEIVGAVRPALNRVLEFVSKEGIMLLLKKFATKGAVRTFARYIPFVGQIIAALAGWGLTSSVGNSYLEDCHKVAEAILKSELKRH